MKITNVSPIGDLDVPLLQRGVFTAGDTIDVTADQATVLLAQTSNFEPADDEARVLLASLEKAAEPAATEPDTTAPEGTDQA